MAPLKVIVVGAGPVGALAALYAAKRGHTVEVYEMRSDLRDPETVPLNFTKSINLALSERGINSLRNARCEGLLEAIIDDTIPMYGRMIHGSKDGKLYEQAQNYDVHGRFIRAADRAALNKRLLDELDRMSNVTLHFSHKLTGADFQNRRAWFEQKDGDTPYSKSPSERAREIEVAFNLMIGADGAHSAVRFHIMKFSRVNYQQEYIDTLWCEFHMPPATDSSGHARFQLSPHHLHIWPAGSFMFIAIPSPDKSFTCTLFMPAHRFEAIDRAPETLLPFFDKSFPGVSALIDPAALLRQYTDNPHLPLISIKCNPYHYGGSAVFVGDAAHAMVPFYGQGMNAGLEDVRVLFDVWDTKLGEAQLSLPFAKPLDHSLPISETLLEAILSQYTAQRMPDAHTINDLAMRNYGEMRSDVRSPMYLLRKRVEEFLDSHAPSLGFTTQYARISFSNQPYSQVADAIRRQTSSLHVAAGVFAAAVGTGAAVAWSYLK